MRFFRAVFSVLVAAIIFMSSFAVAESWSLQADSLFENIEQSLLATSDRSKYQINEDAVYWEGYDRTNPIPVGTTVWWKTEASSYQPEYYYEMSVDKVIRGTEAADIVAKANMFNDAADDEHEYIVVYMTIKGQSENVSERLSIDAVDFDFVSSNGNIYSRTGTPSGFYNDLEFYSGASSEYVTAMLISKTDTPLMVYDEDMWFALN